MKGFQVLGNTYIEAGRSGGCAGPSIAYPKAPRCRGGAKYSY